MSVVQAVREALASNTNSPSAAVEATKHSLHIHQAASPGSPLILPATKAKAKRAIAAAVLSTCTHHSDDITELLLFRVATSFGMNMWRAGATNEGRGSTPAPPRKTGPCPAARSSSLPQRPPSAPSLSPRLAPRLQRIIQWCETIFPRRQSRGPGLSCSIAAACASEARPIGQFPDSATS